MNEDPDNPGLAPDQTWTEKDTIKPKITETKPESKSEN